MRYQFLRFPEGKAKAVTFSYDDGCRDDLRFADELARHGIKCTFNLNSDASKSHPLTREEVEEHFFQNGHDVAVHGAWHRAPGRLRPIEGIRDALDGRLEVEKKFGRIVKGFAYPDTGLLRLSGGVTVESIEQYLKELEFGYARTLDGDNDRFELPHDFLQWTPTAHHTNPKLMDYIQKFLAADCSTATYRSYRYPHLFYLWGHSFEFTRDNNWDYLTEICEKLGGHEDIWYANNTEIFEYVTAYQSLVYSADGMTVYNPTLFTIYMDVDGKPVTLPSGATISLA